jgi:hypothetical protein
MERAIKEYCKDNARGGYSTDVYELCARLGSKKWSDILKVYQKVANNSGSRTIRYLELAMNMTLSSL